MKRKYVNDLKDWRQRSQRKPLVLRGARQVGKTHLVRNFGQEDFAQLIEINFDQNPERSELFRSKNPERILSLIAIEYNIQFDSENTLLFLDEIQVAPEVFATLRYFYEQCPKLCIIAAGSLLDFILQDHIFSMPVGRIEYMFMGPMDFEEYLDACGESQLLQFLHSWQVPLELRTEGFEKNDGSEDIPLSIHNKLVALQSDYCVVGGMPAVVQVYVESKDFTQVQREQSAILQTYRDDFSKYAARVDVQHVQQVFDKIPQLIGNKIKYVNINRDQRAKDIEAVLRMLRMARVIYAVRHSSANGQPLRAEVNERDYKVLFLDVGLMLNALGLRVADVYSDLMNIPELTNKGAVAEQFIGQQLLYMQGAYNYQEPELFYWNREKKNAAAEVDYVVQCANDVIPVEVKAGKTGSMRSLHVFVAEKKSNIALRFNMDRPSCMCLQSQPQSQPQTAGREPHTCTLLSLPLYMVGEMKRLIEQLKDRPDA